MSTGVGVGVGLGVSVGACVSECVSACVRDCFEKAWAMPEFGYQTLLKRCFGKAWAAADINADTFSQRLRISRSASPMVMEGLVDGKFDMILLAQFAREM